MEKAMVGFRWENSSVLDQWKRDEAAKWIRAWRKDELQNGFIVTYDRVRHSTRVALRGSPVVGIITRI